MTDTEQSTPAYDPPRFWWTKRIALGSVALVLLSFGLLTTATMVAQRRLDALKESYRAAGEPVYLEDFNVFKEIPDEQNAAAYYKRAEQAHILPREFDRDVETEIIAALDRSYLKEYAEEVANYLSTNGVVFDLLSKGAHCSDAEWGISLASPMISWRTSMSGTRDLAKLVRVAVERAGEDEQHDQLADYLWQILRLGRHRATGPPTISTPLASRGIGWLAHDLIEDFSHRLIIDDEAEHPTGAATRLQIYELIRELSDESQLIGARSSGAWQERAQVIEAFELLVAGEPIANWQDPMLDWLYWPFRPLLLRDARCSAEILGGLERALAASTYPDAIDQFTRAARSSLPRSGRAVVHRAVPMRSWEQWVYFDFRCQATRRMAKVALAV